MKYGSPEHIAQQQAKLTEWNATHGKHRLVKIKDGNSPFGINHDNRRAIRLGKRCVDKKGKCIWGPGHKCRIKEKETASVEA